MSFQGLVHGVGSFPPTLSHSVFHFIFVCSSFEGRGSRPNVEQTATKEKQKNKKPRVLSYEHKSIVASSMLHGKL